MFLGSVSGVGSLMFDIRRYSGLRCLSLGPPTCPQPTEKTRKPEASQAKARKTDISHRGGGKLLDCGIQCFSFKAHAARNGSPQRREGRDYSGSYYALGLGLHFGNYEVTSPRTCCGFRICKRLTTKTRRSAKGKVAGMGVESSPAFLRSWVPSLREERVGSP